MNRSRNYWITLAAGLAAAAWSSSAIAQSNAAPPAQSNAAPSAQSNAAPTGAAQPKAPAAVIGDNDSIFIDGAAFTVTPGKAKRDVSLLVGSLGAQELGPGAIVFRSGEKLYLFSAPFRASNEDMQLYITGETARPNRISIDYVEPKSQEFKEVYDILRQTHGLETMQQILSPLILPEQLTIRAKECGMVNAWYNREDGKPVVNICYDMLNEYLTKLPKEKTPAGITPQDAIAGQFFWLVTHETGHAVFDMFGIPILAHEEDAADNFATYIMLQFGKERARKLISGAAWSYKQYISDYRTNREVQFRLAGFASDHGQPEERFYNLMCMAYGADPQTFGDLTQDGWLPPTRAPNCGREYVKLVYAFHKQISPHIDQELAKRVLDTKWLSTTGPFAQK